MKTLMTRFHGGSSRSDFAYLLKLIKINNGFWSTETPDGEIAIPPGQMITVEVDDRGNVAVFRVTKDGALPATDGALDAARYRWLRAKHNAGDEHAFVYGAKDDLDEYIDAEMKRE